MTLLIYSGLLYLLGISIVLYFKPELMFSKEGNWKEFGLGRNKERYTWLPFWLFAIMWAMMSYVIVLVIASHTGLGGVNYENEINVVTEEIEVENVSQKPLSNKTSMKKKLKSPEDLKEGYYILDANETMKQGVPKYIYLGPQAPNLIYHNQTSSESDLSSD
jgi:hypothetical protein